MQLTRIVVLGVALVSGGAAALLGMNLTAPVPVETPVAETPLFSTAEVLVANRDISVGTSVGPDMVEWRKWPQTGLSGRFMVRSLNPDAIAQVVQAIARASFAEGEPITEGKIIRPGGGFMAAILPAGMRAVAITIAADTSAGGFILPNDHVDVIMVRRQENAVGSTGSGYITETVLNNVRVLAIDQTIEDLNGEQVVVGQTATLEVSPQQAKILTVAQQIGDQLTLALRSFADSKTTDADGSDAVHLIINVSGLAGNTGPIEQLDRP